MKRVFFIFAFLLLAGSVLAMNDPIRVKTYPGNEVRVFIWPAEYGPVINSDMGFADENGFFESKIFFSLDSDNYTLQVSVFDSDSEKINGANFEEMNSFSSIFIDCFSSECKISAPWKVENKTVENESIVEVNETNKTIESNESIVDFDNDTVAETESDLRVENKKDIFDFILTGKSVFVKKDGSINWVYSIGGFVVLIALVLFVFMMIHGGRKKGTDVSQSTFSDDRALERMEKKLRDTENQIKEIKNQVAKRKRFEDVKSRLVSDEKELQDLQESEVVDDFNEEKNKEKDSLDF